MRLHASIPSHTSACLNITSASADVQFERKPHTALSSDLVWSVGFPVPVVDAETGADGMLKPFRSDGVLLSLGPMQDLLHGWDLGDHIIHCLGLPRIALFDAFKREV